MGIIDSLCEMFSPFSSRKKKDMLDAVNDIAREVASIREINEKRVQKVREYKKQLEELQATTPL